MSPEQEPVQEFLSQQVRQLIYDVPMTLGGDRVNDRGSVSIGDL